MPDTTLDESIALLMERVNHIEDLLVTTLFGFLLTTTFSVFAAIYTLRGDPPRTAVSPRQLVVAANILYLFLGGYYYFMLAQSYATFVTAIPIAERAGIDIEPLWSTLRMPNLGFIPDSIANLVVLLGAPTLPLLFTVFVLVAATRFIGKQPGSRRIGPLTLTLCILSQVAMFFIMIYQPFIDFLSITKVLV